MTEKSVEQMARDTLNALIAGEYLKTSLIKSTVDGLRVDQQALREVESQLREYYSTGPYKPAEPVSMSFRI
mgnify:CR=1 FL=1